MPKHAGSFNALGVAQVMLKLVTSIESAQATEASAAGRSGASEERWNYTGAISLVKSALQKNVRLGRAAEAVRCCACCG